MAMFRGLSLLIVVTIVLNNGCMSNAPNKDKQLSCEDSVIFRFDGEEIYLLKDEFNLKVQANNCDLIILNEEKLASIRIGKLPVISFCINNKKYRAKGNKILNSSVPKDCDSFFPINDDGTISFFKRNVISFIMIKQ